MKFNRNTCSVFKDEMRRQTNRLISIGAKCKGGLIRKKGTKGRVEFVRHQQTVFGIVHANGEDTCQSISLSAF
jgi:hypothetical protein